MTAVNPWEMRVLELEERLGPIARRPVDITQAGWADRLRAQTPAVDEAGVRHAMEGLLEELITAYALAGEALRAEFRRWFAQYPAFAWAAALRTSPATEQGFRQHLILFSMQDQGRDPRDALLALQVMCAAAAAAGVAIKPILEEIAAISSSTNRFGMGSTRDMLLRQSCSR